VSINNQSLLEIARLNGDAIISLQSSRKALQIITHTPRWLPSEDRNQVDAPILCHYCLGVFYIYIHIHLRYSVGLTDAWQARDTHCDRSDKSWAASKTVEVNKNIIKNLHLLSNIKYIYIYDFIKIFKGPLSNELSLIIN